MEVGEATWMSTFDPSKVNQRLGLRSYHNRVLPVYSREIQKRISRKTRAQEILDDLDFSAPKTKDREGYKILMVVEGNSIKET